MKRYCQIAYPPRKEIVKVPSIFTAEDTRRARNSINFFGWQPNSASGDYNRIHAEFELLDETDTVIGETFEGAPTTVRVSGRKTDLTID